MNEYQIDSIIGVEIIDSRANLTLRVFVKTKSGYAAYADAPAGKSKSSKEAFELRDSNGITLNNALRVIENYVEPALKGVNVTDQRNIDKILKDIDGTNNFSKIGGNVAIATSLAASRTASLELGVDYFFYIGGKFARTIPVPLLNIINGGVHAGNNLRIQEFLIIPFNFETFKEAIEASSLVYHKLKGKIKEKFGPIFTSVADEGGFSPPLSRTEEALNLVYSSIKDAGFDGRIAMGMDAAASEFYYKEKLAYVLDDKEFSKDELLDYYRGLVDEYPLLYLEDPFHENDMDSFTELQKNLKKTIIVGDDLYATNSVYLTEGIKGKATKGVIVKPNQIGTLSGTFDFVELAKRNNIKTIVSHRSGDTEDNYVADLAVGLSSDFIKSGAPARGERISKYNRLLTLEKLYELKYLGKNALYL
ncbi:enolase [Sulfolobales archaeon HS-7]|nr:enolase [Sulfolobales archaeon HS-7]